ncbi:AMP-binding protein [Maricaulis salignorans]|uniref:AMP-binding protein n=1 Tax=Maricaulis salignorans TaxID=144026 RepID=UPI003A90DDB0
MTKTASPRLLDRISAIPGSQTAVVTVGTDGETRWSYGQLLSEAGAWTQRLSGLGLEAGDAIGLWLPNCAPWLAIELAASTLGLLVVPVNPRLRGNDARALLERAGLRCLVAPEASGMVDFDALLGEALASPLPGLDHVLRIDIDAQIASGAEAGIPRAAGGDLALNCFSTSGSTGAPKLAMHRQSSLVIRFSAAAQRFGINSGDAVLCALPLCGVWGLGISLAALMRGASCVFLPVFSASRAAGAMHDYQIAHVHGGDNLVREILNAPTFQGEQLPYWRSCYFGAFTGSPAAETIRMIATSGAVQVQAAQAYGSSEALAFVAGAAPNAPEPERLLAGGPYLDDMTQARAVSPDGSNLPHGERGELQVTGACIMLGYRNDSPASTAAMTPDGWYRTGDLGYTTPGGLVFISRLGDALRLRGNLIDPAEIEHHIGTHPDVEEVHVVGVSLPSRGDVAVAFVRVSSPGLDEPTLKAFCKSRIAGFKIPDRIVLTDAIPVTVGANGTKVKKGELRERALAYFDTP